MPSDKKTAKRKPSPAKKKALSLRECTVLRFCCNDRIDRIKGPGVASSYGLNLAMIEEIRALFLKLTGYPLDQE